MVYREQVEQRAGDDPGGRSHRRAAQAARGLRRLASFALGSGIGLLVDIGGFWMLSTAGVEPGVANALSSSAAVVVTYLFVTRRTFRSRISAGTFVCFAVWYAANIAAVSWVVQFGTSSVGGEPIFWKLGCVPASFAANYVFNLVLHGVARRFADSGSVDPTPVAAP